MVDCRLERALNCTLEVAPDGSVLSCVTLKSKSGTLSDGIPTSTYLDHAEQDDAAADAENSRSPGQVADDGSDTDDAQGDISIGIRTLQEYPVNFRTFR